MHALNLYMRPVARRRAGGWGRGLNVVGVKKLSDVASLLVLQKLTYRLVSRVRGIESSVYKFSWKLAEV